GGPGDGVAEDAAIEVELHRCHSFAVVARQNRGDRTGQQRGRTVHSVSVPRTGRRQNGDARGLPAPTSPTAPPPWPRSAATPRARARLPVHTPVEQVLPVLIITAVDSVDSGHHRR